MRWQSSDAFRALEGRMDAKLTAEREERMRALQELRQQLQQELRQEMHTLNNSRPGTSSEPLCAEAGGTNSAFGPHLNVSGQPRIADGDGEIGVRAPPECSTNSLHGTTQSSQLAVNSSIGLKPTVKTIDKVKDRFKGATVADFEDEDGLKTISLDIVEARETHTSVDAFVIQGNVWNAVIFSFHESVSLFDSCYCALLMTLAAVLQGIACVVIRITMAESGFDDDTIKAYQWFRTLTAHDIKYMDRASKISLADRVCNLNAHKSLEVAAQQANVVRDVSVYTSRIAGFPSGFLMCAVVVLAWCFLVMKVLRQDIQFMSALFCLPVHGPTLIKLTPRNTFLIRSLSRRRQCVLALVGVIRIAICVWILYVGTLFLIYTPTVPDLILNAVAVGFVLDLDELIYESLAPGMVRTLVMKTEPLRTSRWLQHLKFRRCGNFDLLAEGAGIVVCLLFCALAVPQMLAEHRRRQAAHAALCEGSRTFVYKDLPFGIINWAETTAYESFAHTPTYKYRHLQEIIAQGKAAAITKVGWGGFIGLPAHERRRVEQTGDLVSPSCLDVESWPSQWDSNKPIFIGALQDQARDASVASCRDVEHLCDRDSDEGLCIRLICPETCGCSTPSSSNPLAKTSQGCPGRCRERPEFLEQRSEAICRDLSPAELRNTANWTSLVQRMRQTVKTWTPGFRELFKAVADLLWDTGCAAMTGIDQFGEDINLCTGEGAINPIKALSIWCPEACGCKLSGAPIDCPLSCGQH